MLVEISWTQTARVLTGSLADVWHHLGLIAPLFGCGGMQEIICPQLLPDLASHLTVQWQHINRVYTEMVMP